MSITEKIREREAAMAQQQRNAAVAALWNDDEDAAMNAGLPSAELVRIGRVIEEAKSLIAAAGDLGKTRKAAKKAQRALAGYDARMEAAIANLEKERAPLAFDFDDTRHSLNEAESAARKLTALHRDNDCVLPLDRLPKCVREVLASNSAEQARQQAQARHIKAWERMTAIKREIADLRARRNRASHEITSERLPDMAVFDEKESELRERLEAVKQQVSAAESALNAKQEKRGQN